MGYHLDSILNNMPDFIKKDESSAMYKFMKCFADEIDDYESKFTVVYNMRSINTSEGDILDKKWGRLYNVIRRTGESDYEYRVRLMNKIASMAGGTRSAIAGALATVLRISGDEIDTRILISDGASYTGSDITDPSILVPGMIIVHIDLNGLDISQVPRSVFDSLVSTTINATKASGTSFYVVATGIRYSTHQQMYDANATHAALSELQYDQIG